MLTKHHESHYYRLTPIWQSFGPTLMVRDASTSATWSPLILKLAVISAASLS